MILTRPAQTMVMIMIIKMMAIIVMIKMIIMIPENGPSFCGSVYTWTAQIEGETVTVVLGNEQKEGERQVSKNLCWTMIIYWLFCPFPQNICWTMIIYWLSCPFPQNNCWTTIIWSILTKSSRQNNFFSCGTRAEMFFPWEEISIMIITMFIIILILMFIIIIIIL